MSTSCAVHNFPCEIFRSTSVAIGRTSPFLSHGLEPRASDPSRSSPNVHRPATPDDLEGMGPAAPALAALGRLVLFRGGRGEGIAAADDRRRPRDHRRRAPVAHGASYGSGAKRMLDHFAPLALMGLLNNAMPFVLIASGQTRLAGGLASI